MDNGNLYVLMYFRGKNKFGGYVRNLVSAETGEKCNIVRIIQEGSL